ncbi:protein of unknown function DUF214 [Alkaliphilus metalliredigens QYMF]|uniref:ABC3 transporter permease protein domain-containing protein n=1 Tax=Alkaliphilus metalliredigens (strain QYMF) TaxID=293826 RepID=A6TK80_ALKMQ|nr:FtsX-like permease family protein [Alkaliphilus metalliredigens]ABR46598.1 protein of unknown function DUF214 [Alkaliphilus metalliredigens QYMF]
MNSLDLFKMALDNLLRRKTRTVLTVLGVVIGTSSIVVMLSLGIAMNEGFKDQLSNMGDLTMIDVHNYGGYDGDGRSSQSKQVHLNDDAVRRFKQIPKVQGVMATKSAYMKMAAGNMVGYVPIIGIDPLVMEAFGFKVAEGRILMPTDKESIVFGKNIAMNMYNPRLRNAQRGGWGNEQPQVNLISNRLELTTNMEYGEVRNVGQETDQSYTPPKPHNVQGVGILEESFSEKDYNAYMNITALEKILEEDRRANRQDRSMGNMRQNENDYERVSIKVNEIDDVLGVQEIVKDMGFQAFSLTDMLNSMQETAQTIQMVLGGIGAVSLFVAAIGITNTMIMSIYERTREIGIIKVLGANLSDIRKLFLIEAAMIGLLGGIMGLVLSYTISFGLNKINVGFMGPGGGDTAISIIPIQLSLAAVAFATVIGIVSGYSPARRAMKLSALEAIKSE